MACGKARTARRVGKARGISVWLFSKIVMLVFLFVVFGTVLGFLRIVNEKVSADSAEALAMQVRGALHAVLESTAVSASMLVPLPKTLPSETQAGLVSEARLKTYSVKIVSPPGSGLVSVAVSWDTPPKTFIAASSYAASQPVKTLVADSVTYRYLLVSKNTVSYSICRCESAECPKTPKDCCVPGKVCEQLA